MKDAASDRFEEIGPSGAGAVFFSVTKDFLYLLPLDAGERIVSFFSRIGSIRPQVEWFAGVLSLSPSGLIERVKAEGDEEDKRVCLDVFLWKQRHNSISRSLRIGYDFDNLAGARYIHRYMTANAYEGILDVPRHRHRNRFGPNSGLPYLDQIGILLDRFRSSDFSELEDEFGELLLLLSILGPKFKSYARLPEVQDLASFLLDKYGTDPRLTQLSDDINFANLVLLFCDLGIDRSVSWPAFEYLALKKPKRSVSSYPGFIAAKDMYGKRIDDLLASIDVQGGSGLFQYLGGWAGEPPLATG